MLCCGYTLTDFPISIKLTSLALWQSNDCLSASKATRMNMDKYFMWIHYERLHNHNKAEHNKTVCIFLGIYCNHKGHGYIDLLQPARSRTNDMCMILGMYSCETIRLQWNLSVTTTSIKNVLTVIYLVMCFNENWRYQFTIIYIALSHLDELPKAEKYPIRWSLRTGFTVSVYFWKHGIDSRLHSPVFL